MPNPDCSPWSVWGDRWLGPWGFGRRLCQTSPHCDLSPLTSGWSGAPVCCRWTADDWPASDTWSPPPCLRSEPDATEHSSWDTWGENAPVTGSSCQKDSDKPYEIRLTHLLIRSQTPRSCALWRGLCSPTGWWGWSGGWTGSCCCWTGLCRRRTAARRGRERTCWALTWGDIRPSIKSFFHLQNKVNQQLNPSISSSWFYLYGPHPVKSLNFVNWLNHSHCVALQTQPVGTDRRCTHTSQVFWITHASNVISVSGFTFQ